tara:strand:- start:6108 stop:6278 length:171 start_codon:yes stop_codon:yes gene_type:complete
MSRIKDIPGNDQRIDAEFLDRFQEKRQERLVFFGAGKVTERFPQMPIGSVENPVGA